MTGDDARLVGLAERLHAALRRQGATIAVAESLTGGLVGAALTSVAGASATFLGGVTAYATPAKTAVLGVDAGLLARAGAVDPDVAVAMARGAQQRFGATYAVSTTGVAGPDGQDGKPPGTVHVAFAGRADCQVRSLRLAGDRRQVRQEAAAAALQLACDELESNGGPSPEAPC